MYGGLYASMFGWIRVKMMLNEKKTYSSPLTTQQYDKERLKGSKECLEIQIYISLYVFWICTLCIDLPYNVWCIEFIVWTLKLYT